MMQHLRIAENRMSLSSADGFFSKRRFPPPGTTEVLQAYLCVFCQRILDLDRPHQSSCGDRACYTCLEVLASDFKQRCIGSVKCPGCQQPIQPSEFFLDHAVARELKCILVTCPNHECQWRNCYEYYQYHLQRCPLKHLEGTSTTEEPASESEPATPDPGFAGSELITGFKLPLLDMRDYVSTRSEVVPGLEILVPAVMEMDTNECVLPSIPYLPQRKVIDDVQRQLCEIDSLNSNLLGIGEISNATEDLQDCYDNKEVIRNEGNSPSSMPPRSDLSHIETAIKHIEEHITELTGDFPSLKADFQKLQLRINTQTKYRSTEKATSKVQVATKELQDYYSELALLMQTKQTSSYGSVYIWKIPEFIRRCKDAALGKTISLYSAPFYTSRHGYKLYMRVYLNRDGADRGSHISLIVCLMKADFDSLLPWPFRQTITLVYLSQDTHIKDVKQSFKPDSKSSSFLRPVSEMNVVSGCPQFCPLDHLNDPAYIWNNTLYLKASVSTRGIEHLT